MCWFLVVIMSNTKTTKKINKRVLQISYYEVEWLALFKILWMKRYFSFVKIISRILSFWKAHMVFNIRICRRRRISLILAIVFLIFIVFFFVLIFGVVCSSFLDGSITQFAATTVGVFCRSTLEAKTYKTVINRQKRPSWLSLLKIIDMKM